MPDEGRGDNLLASLIKKEMVQIIMITVMIYMTMMIIIMITMMIMMNIL